jgi:23S rRNA (cytosine1962-C5)-methyltransferase
VKEIKVNKAAAAKLARFFPWVYHNETVQVPRDLNRGELVRVLSSAGGFLGIGYINPASAIAVRILSFVERPVDKEFLQERIAESWERRANLMKNTDAFRVVHAEADDLPGLVVDYYNEYLSLQINTAGMERMRGEILASLVEVMHPRGIYERSDGVAREKEGIGSAEGVVYGKIPQELTIEENRVRFKIRLRDSQKTGFYLDQRRNREVVSSYVGKGFRVLDVFSHTGGFGLYASLKGAQSVTLVDQSATVLELARENIKLNGLKTVTAVRADAFDYLADEFSRGGRYDLIVLDPPSFTRTRGAKGGALKGYRRIIFAGLKLIRPKGYIVAFSCSHHISLGDLECVSLQAAADADCRLEIKERLFQDCDHPCLISIPQSFYLKGFLFQKVSP